MIRGFLFDLGGTLFHFQGHSDLDLFRMGSERSYALLTDRHSLRVDYETYYRLVSRAFKSRWYWSLVSGREISARRLFRRLGGPLGLDPAEDIWPNIERAWHEPAGERVQIIDGGAELLEALKNRGARLGITSNTVWSGPVVLGMLDQLKIRTFFETFTFSSEIGFRKPHRKIYLDALQKMGLPRSQVGFIGNQFREDVRGPQRHGMRAIYLSQKESHFPFFSPRHQARTLAEVKEIALGWCQ
ncbi:MAG: HAD family hydrolase [Planctomycetota bacterium]|nr:HAD family hydrolase [Planctomycetota bacterium]